MPISLNFDRYKWYILIPLIVGWYIYNSDSPTFIRNYIPDFLWSFAFYFGLFSSSELSKWYITLLIITLGCSYELGQMLGYFKGTADVFDVITYSIGVFFAFLFTYKM